MDTVPTILIVDDELDNFDVLETMLMSEHYQVHYAAQGLQALSFLEITQPDVILLDVMMPEMDGIEVCRRIKANRQWSHIPIVIVTALTAKEDLARCLEAGATDFLSKPVNRLELCARVRSMIRIKQQYDDLQGLLQMREDMVNMIVHDLRNPLASIILAAEILKFPNLSPSKQQIKVDQIALAGQQLRSQIDNLLLMAKMESGKMVLNPSDIDLVDLCKSALEDFRAIAAQKNLQLVSQFPLNHTCVRGDANLIRRIVDNLFSNAVKFSPANSAIVVQVDASRSGGGVIRVTDSGPGVSEELRHHIFEKYEIGTLIQGTSQTGLGLAFCKMAIEAHQGSITVESHESQGSTFTISLP